MCACKGKGQFDPGALKDTAAEVARFHKEIQEKYHLPAERIFVVGASGLFSALGDESKAKEKIAQALKRIERVNKLAVQLGAGNERLPLKERCVEALAFSEVAAMCFYHMAPQGL